MDKKAFKRILVIRFSSLGDVVLTTPLFETLRKSWPDAHIVALTKESFADVLRRNPNIDECWTLKKGESLFELMKRVRAGKFDAVLDLHSNLRSHLVTLFSGTSTVVRYRKAALARRLYVFLRWNSASLHEHTFDRYRNAAERLGAAPSPHKILVLQTAFLGDAVLTTPLLTALHDTYPETEVTVLCTPEVSEIFHRHAAVHDIVIFDKRGKDRSIGGLRRLARELRERHFDMAFVPHRSFKSALLSWMASIPRRIGFSSSQGRLFLTDIIPFEWGVHDADRNLALLKAVGATPVSGVLSVPTDPEAAQKVLDRRKAEGIGDTDLIVGVNAGSVWATKRWLPEGFAAVADRLIRERGVKVVFFGGSKDLPSVEAVRALMKEKAHNWVGKTNLRELIAGIAGCDAFLTNDSGPMHIAVAEHVPTVAIFGPTTEELGFFPYGKGHIVIQKDLPCRPCGLHGGDQCPLGHFQCMKLIEPNEVFQAVVQQLQRSSENKKASFSVTG